jgi:electron transfer flavoprotein alpha subunit
MPRVAALLDVMQISDVRSSRPDTFERPIYAGNAMQTVQSTDAKKVITVRTAAFQAAGEGGSARSRPLRRPPTRRCRASSRTGDRQASDRPS